MRDDGQDTNARGVAARGEDAWFDGVGDIVFGGDEDDVALETRGTIGHGPAGGDTSGEVEGDEGFAEAGVGVEEGEFATEDAFFPEPVELAFLYVGEGGARIGCWCSGGLSLAEFLFGFDDFVHELVDRGERIFMRCHMYWYPFYFRWPGFLC